MYYYPPPTNPYAPSPQMVPGGGPFQPFPGGPWFRVTSAGVLQIYYNYQWTTTPSAAPNLTNPGFTPQGVTNPNGTRGVGRPPNGGTSGGAGLAAGGLALYDSLSRLWDAINAVRAEEAAIDEAVRQGRALTEMETRAKAWADWTANDPGGQKMAKVYNCIQNNIVKAQDEIDKIVNKPNESRTQADYARLAVLRQAVKNMTRMADYYRELRHDYITYGQVSGQNVWPAQIQIDSFTCEAIPLETAPYPTTPTSQGPMATVPDNVPADCAGFALTQGTAYPSSGDYFPDEEVVDDGGST